MSGTRLTEETVGKFFEDSNGSVWQHIAYCAYPTASVELVTRGDGRAVEPKTRRGGAIGCHNLESLGLRLLVPEAVADDSGERGTQPK